MTRHRLIARGLYALLLATSLPSMGATDTAPANSEVFKHPTTGRELIAKILAEPSRNLTNSAVLQGQFVHQKYLSEIPQPLTATGDFVFGRDLGVYWHTQQPFDSVFVLTQQGMIQRDEGKETLRLSTDEQPAVRVIADIFLAMFTLDMTTLNNSFELFGQQHGTQWTIGLTPKSSAVASVFKQAVVSGNKDVEQVTITDQQGDRTVINLQSVTHSNDISPTVRALFKR